MAIWSLALKDGFPRNNGEVVSLRYSYGGSVDATKTLSQEILEYDCFTNGGIALKTVNVVDDDRTQESRFDVSIDSGRIQTSPFYTAVNASYGLIDFCVRVDYKFRGGIMNFHHTRVQVAVDPSRNFFLYEPINSSVERHSTVQAEVTAGYDVIAYHCKDNMNTEMYPGPFTKGTYLQVCVQISAGVSTKDLYISSIEDFTLSQRDSTISHPISKGKTNYLTTMDCTVSGKCRIRTQLESKWFEKENSPDLRINGLAVVGFGDGRLRKLRLSPQSNEPTSNHRSTFEMEVLLTGASTKESNATISLLLLFLGMIITTGLLRKICSTKHRSTFSDMNKQNPDESMSPEY